MEPPAAARVVAGPARIAWWSARSGAVSGAVRAQLLAAASALAGDVEIVELGPPIPDGAPISGMNVLSPTEERPLDAVVTLGALANPERSTLPLPDWSTSPAPRPLVVALAPDGATGEHLRLLGHEANIVLPATTHGRVVLATVLALLRWRAG
jgi:hypothetical protein